MTSTVLGLGRMPRLSGRKSDKARPRCDTRATTARMSHERRLLADFLLKEELMTVLRSVALGMAVTLLAGCSPGSTSTITDGVPAVRRIALDTLPDGPAHPDSATPIVVGLPDTGDPVQVATNVLVLGLTQQGLDVLDLGADVPGVPSGEQVTVRVAITHANSEGVEHTSVYDVDLTRSNDRTWTVVAVRVVG